MRKIRKRVKQAGVVALAVVVAALSSVAVAPPAGALEEEPIVYEAKPGSTVKRDAAIPMGAANDAAGLFHTPGDCATSPTCTEIPLKIVLPPEFDPDSQDFVVLVTLTWNLAGSPDENAINDLDMYIYDMNRISEETGEEEPTIAAQSATGSMPEVAKMFSPAPDVDYRILVSNFAGPNTGFTLELSYKDFSFEAPDEGEPIGGSGSGSTGGDDFTVDEQPTESDDTATDFDGDVDLAAPPIGGAETPALNLPETDDDFTDGFSSAGGAAAGRTPSLFGDDEGPGEAKPVGGAILAAWLGVAPLALLGAVIAFILKRRPPALSMAFPTGPVRVDHRVDA
jgi:hypothetical protein